MTLSLCACEKVYDVAYYAENCKKAQEVLEKCKTGHASGDNCTNATHGLSKFNAEAFRSYMLGETKTKPADACQ